MQALIITAYHDYPKLERNLRLYSKGFNCYVHIDANSKEFDEQKIKKLNEIENVHVISKYKILWGSYLHMMAIIELIEEALKNKENTYFHIISGDDFPTKDYREYYDFFEKDGKKYNYLEVTDISNMPVMQKRYKIFHFMHILNRKSKHRSVLLLDKCLRHIQYHLPIKRRRAFKYKGLVWCSITREAAEYTVNTVRHNGDIKVLKYCEIAEEFLFSNTLLESENFKDTVIWDKKRLTIWENEHSTGPRELDINDLDTIRKSDCYFARKVVNNENNHELYEHLYSKFEKSLL